MGDVLDFPTREQLRSRRHHPTRARTINVKRLPKGASENLLTAEDREVLREAIRPKTRADCIDGPRPCPWVSCKHHLYADVNPKSGSIKLNFPDLEPEQLAETCVLDMADRGGMPLEDVGRAMNITRERVRQVEVKGLAKLAALRDQVALLDYVDGGPIGKRRLPIIRGDGT